MNIQLLKPSDFNQKLREHEVDKKVTVQKIFRVCRDERDVRVVLDEMWQNPSKAQGVLSQALSRNHIVFAFERELNN